MVIADSDVFIDWMAGVPSADRLETPATITWAWVWTTVASSVRVMRSLHRGAQVVCTASR